MNNKPSIGTLILLYVQPIIFVGCLVYISLNWETPQKTAKRIESLGSDLTHSIVSIEIKVDSLASEIELLREVESDQIIKIKTALSDRRTWIEGVDEFLKDSDRWRRADTIDLLQEIKKTNPSFKMPEIKPADENKFPELSPRVFNNQK